MYTVEEIKGVMTELAENLKENAPSESENIDSVLIRLLDENKIEELEKE